MDESLKIMLNENSWNKEYKLNGPIYKVQKAGKTKLPSLDTALGRKVRK